jgi:hypothetical protein
MSEVNRRDAMIEARAAATPNLDVLDVEVGPATEPVSRQPLGPGRRNALIEQARQSPHASATRKET